VDNLLASNMFFNNHGRTNEGWITALYNDLFSRNPDPNGYAFWLDYLRAGG
jgi:hypothetical protein